MRDWEEQPKFSSDIKDEGKPQGSKATIVDCSTCLRYIFVGIQLTIVLEIYAKNPCSLINPITMICYIMMVTLFLVSGTSMDNCYFQLAGWQLVIREAVSYHAPLDPQTSSIISSILSDVCTVLKVLDLKPPTASYMCCPKCFCCYALDGASSYPDQCTYRDTLTSPPCGRALCKTVVIKGHKKSFPARRYTYNHMKDWMGRMLCHPNLKLFFYHDVFVKGKEVR